MKVYCFIIVISLAIVLVSPVNASLTGTDKEKVKQVLQAGGFLAEEVEPLLGDQRLTLYPEILTQQTKGVDYLHPRFGLLNRSSIKRGQQVLKEKRATLKNIEAYYGVPPEVLVAIFRIETNLGANLGQYRVFNSLLTLTVIVNHRSLWAGQELIDLLTLCKNNRTNPLSIKGSASGAFGLCQFVPSSYLAYGADGNGDGLVDLFDFSDAMASAANFLKSHGWHNRNRQKQLRAILSYNHCENYAIAVLSYSKKVKLAHSQKQTSPRKPVKHANGVRGKENSRT